jgi:hypothetical protein
VPGFVADNQAVLTFVAPHEALTAQLPRFEFLSHFPASRQRLPFSHPLQHFTHFQRRKHTHTHAHAHAQEKAEMPNILELPAEILHEILVWAILARHPLSVRRGLRLKLVCSEFPANFAASNKRADRYLETFCAAFQAVLFASRVLDMPSSARYSSSTAE